MKSIHSPALTGGVVAIACWCEELWNDEFFFCTQL